VAGSAGRGTRTRLRLQLRGDVHSRGGGLGAGVRSSRSHHRRDPDVGSAVPGRARTTADSGQGNGRRRQSGCRQAGRSGTALVSVPRIDVGVIDPGATWSFAIALAPVVIVLLALVCRVPALWAGVIGVATAILGLIGVFPVSAIQARAIASAMGATFLVVAVILLCGGGLRRISALF